jgi:hypothetical protein
MSPAEWMRARAGDAPEPLLGRVEEILAGLDLPAGSPIAEALLRAGEVLLDAVLQAHAGEGRGVALDLLAADACVTWAFEAAADAPGTLGARAEAAMNRIAAVGL